MSKVATSESMTAADAEAPNVPDDVLNDRRGNALSQLSLAWSIGILLGTSRSWEQRRRAPEGAFRVLLARLDRNPFVVAERLWPVSGPECADDLPVGLPSGPGNVRQ